MICVLPPGKNVSLVICFPAWKTHIPSDMCSSSGDTRIPSNTCSPTCETHIPSDMCYPAWETHIPSDLFSFSWETRGGSRGRVLGVRTRPPFEMTCGFLKQLVFCKKKTVWFIGVEVEQETSALPGSWIRPWKQIYP